MIGGTRQFERGDWYTWYLTSAGGIGDSHLHRFTPRDALAETRVAGFEEVRRLGAHVVTRNPETS